MNQSDFLIALTGRLPRPKKSQSEHAAMPYLFDFSGTVGWVLPLISFDVDKPSEFERD
jgi:hypothetical protein